MWECQWLLLTQNHPRNDQCGSVNDCCWLKITLEMINVGVSMTVADSECQVWILIHSASEKAATTELEAVCSCGMFFDVTKWRNMLWSTGQEKCQLSCLSSKTSSTVSGCIQTAVFLTGWSKITVTQQVLSWQLWIYSADLWTTLVLSLIHIWRCRRVTVCRSRWSPYH